MKTLEERIEEARARLSSPFLTESERTELILVLDEWDNLEPIQRTAETLRDWKEQRPDLQVLVRIGRLGDPSP